jgi:hypothetical protein
MKLLAKILLVCGIVCICGTVGALDGDVIAIMQTFKQMLLSVALLAMSYATYFVAIAFE